MGGVTDWLSQAGDWLKDNALPVAEIVVPVIAPWTAPIVAAEHAIRTGITLHPDDAKAATTAATKVGQAVAQQQMAAGTGVPPDDAPPRRPQQTAPKKKAGWLVPAALLLFFL